MWPFGKSEKEAREMKARRPRIKLLLGEESFFKSDSGQKFPVLNISETGLALGKSAFGLKEKISGVLHIGDESIPLTIEIMRPGQTVGAKIIAGEASLRSALRRLFADEFKAQEMSPVAAERLAPETEGNPHWFYAPGNYELYLVEKDSAIVKAHLSWKDRFISLRKDEKAKFGLLLQNDREEPGHAKSALVNWQDSLSEEDRLKALRIVENVSSLDGALKSQLKTLLA
ncbi:MAG: hypothetical protein ACXWQO_08510 [Bdellovibrionota bacterium]